MLEKENSPVRFAETEPEETEKILPSYFRSFNSKLRVSQKDKWIIQDIIPKRAIGLLTGDAGTHKSFIALMLGGMVACGIRWDKGVHLPQTVLYLTHEGDYEDINARMMGLLKNPDFIAHYNEEIIDDLLMKYFKIVDVGDFEHTTGNIMKCTMGMPNRKAWELLVNEMIEYYTDIGLIIIDTFSNFFGGGDENSATAVNDFYMSLNFAKSRLKCSILVIHHTARIKMAKGKATLRGSTVHDASADFIFTVENGEDSSIVLCNDKMRNAKKSTPIAFNLRTVSISEDSSTLTAVHAQA